jgi:hypothetical protein
MADRGLVAVDDGSGLVERGLDLHVTTEGLQDGVAMASVVAG